MHDLTKRAGCPLMELSVPLTHSSILGGHVSKCDQKTMSRHSSLHCENEAPHFSASFSLNPESEIKYRRPKTPNP